VTSTAYLFGEVCVEVRGGVWRVCGGCVWRCVRLTQLGNVFKTQFMFENTTQSRVHTSNERNERNDT
jgi:hypothetical protein